jgi:hypothetical protein
MAHRSPIVSREVIDWLLDPEEPAVRARALVDLEGFASDAAEVREARAQIPFRGTAARILDEADLAAPDLYRPKYGAPYHRLIALAEMGMPANVPRAGALLETCLAHFLGDAPTPRDAEVCVVGNTARAAILMGKGEDPRVQRALAWLVEAQMADGGWHCWPDEVPHGSLDAWEALGAFAALPREDRPASAVARGVDFLLAQRLGMDDAYEPWRRLHFPRHYYYDVLVGLDIVTILGDPRDARLAPAIAWLASKRGADGRWRIDAQHPDLGAGADYTLRDAAQVRPLVVEPTDAPSKWATLAALRVLRR